MLDGLMETFGQVITIYFVFFCLAIYGLVKLQRNLIAYSVAQIYHRIKKVPYEEAFKVVDNSVLWRSLLLPLGPLMTGMSLVLFLPQYPYPELFSSIGGHIVYGLGCGLVSSLIYKSLKESFGSVIKTLKDKVSKP